jgi:hypothetical protein
MTALGDPPTTVGVFAVITQVIVWSPQLAGFIAVPGFFAHGRIVWGPIPLALGWAVMVIVCPPARAAGADA